MAHIRIGTHGDRARISRIVRELPEWFNDEGLAQIDSDLEKSQILVAEMAGEVVGFVLYKTNKSITEIIWMAVQREFHRRGIGTELIGNLIGIAEKENSSHLAVRTLGESDPYEPYIVTREFYNKLGFGKYSNLKTNNPMYAEELELRLAIAS